MKKLFITIYILTIIDIACTVAGVNMGYITEANPVLQSVMHNYPILTGAVMCVGIGAVLYGMYRVRHIRWLKYAAGGMLAVKVMVIGLHVGWIAQIVRTL
jgi:hypothetical protein